MFSNLGWKYFFLCHMVNHLRILFWVKNLLVASYSRSLIALKMCWKVTFGHRFNHKFWMLRNFSRRPECFGKYSFWYRIWTHISYFFEGSRENYCRYYFAQQVTKNMDYNYDPIDGRKYGSLMFCSRIWLRNIFSILRDHSFQNQILVKNFVSGKLFTSLNCFQNA